jgi:hypothetical protein
MPFWQEGYPDALYAHRQLFARPTETELYNFI